MRSLRSQLDNIEKSLMENDEERECSICFTNLKNVIVLPCLHKFCDQCYTELTKLGKCPYRFQTEKHPRRIRTLEQSKSNRFNLIQELSKVFECYPQFYIEFDTNGRVLLDENGRMKKHVFFMTEKGAE